MKIKLKELVNNTNSNDLNQIIPKKEQQNYIQEILKILNETDPSLELSEKLKSISENPSIVNNILHSITEEEIEKMLYILMGKKEIDFEQFEKMEPLINMGDSFCTIISYALIKNENYRKKFIPLIIEKLGKQKLIVLDATNEGVYINKINNKSYLISILENVNSFVPLNKQNIKKLLSVCSKYDAKKNSWEEDIYGKLMKFLKNIRISDEELQNIWKNLLFREFEGNSYCALTDFEIIDEFNKILDTFPNLLTNDEIQEILLFYFDKYDLNNIEMRSSSSTERKLLTFSENIIELRPEIFDKSYFEDLSRWSSWKENLVYLLDSNNTDFKNIFLKTLFPYLGTYECNKIKIKHIRDLDRLLELSNDANGSNILKLLSMENNISFFGRYSIKTLKQLYKNFGKEPSKDQKTALWIFPKDDWNNALYYQNDFLDELIDKNYFISIVEVENELEFKSWTLLMKNRNNKKFDAIIINGHGTSTSIQFGDKNNEKKLQTN